MSKRELAIAFILIVGILAPIISLFPSAEGAWPPEEQTVDIVDTHDDRWITETGRLFDSPLVQILDPNYGITSYLIFRDVEINGWEPLTNATLRLRTTSNQTFDDSSVTIYGMKVDELQTISVGASFVLSVPYTTAHVDYNTSLFSGSAWHDIDVTAIVEELIRAYHWDGVDYPEDVGDAIGFVILGAKGSDTRWFQDYRSYPPNSADLVIHWNHRPPGIDLPDNSEWVEQYRNYTIWAEIFGPGAIEYIFVKEGTYDLTFDNLEGDGPVVIHTPVAPSDFVHPGQRKIVLTVDGVLYVIHAKLLETKYQIYVIKSVDDGVTWINSTHISTLDIMSTQHQHTPAIALDSQKNIHATWAGLATGFPNRQIWYSNYTGSWSDPIRLSTGTDMNLYWQQSPSIAIDESDNVHIVWMGQNYDYSGFSTIFYINSSTNWTPIVSVCNYSGMNSYTQLNPEIVIDSNNIPHVVWQGPADVTAPKDGIWYTNYTNFWSEAYLVSTRPDMNHKQEGPSLLVDYNNNVQVVWSGTSADHVTWRQIWYRNRTIGWGDILWISNHTLMPNYPQDISTISTDSDNFLHVLWNGRGQAGENHIWYSVWNGSWQYPVQMQNSVRDLYPSSRWSRWPSLNYSTYFITDINGTIIDNDCPDVDCAKDKIDDIMGDDPMDPEPDDWEGSPPEFSRFRMRLYLLIVGYGCVWGPIWFFCWKRPSGYYIGVAFIIMLMGLGLLLQIPNV